MSGTGAVIWLAVFLAPSALADLVPGTYDVIMCAEPCESDRPAKPYVRGSLVLWGSDFDTSSLPQAEREYLMDHSTFSLQPDQKPNACFVLELVDEGTPPVGSTRVGLTRWSYSAGVLTVALERSEKPSHAYGVFAGGSILGGYPEEARLRALSPSNYAFLSGTKTGGADSEVCLRAVRREFETERAIKR